MRLRSTLAIYAAIAFVFAALAPMAGGQTTSSLQVMPDGQRPPDSRLGELQTLNGHFPFEVPATKEEWLARADQLRNTILVATGLSPMPARTPLNAVIHGRLQRDGFTVERVYFESLPGHFVTGLLFRPDGASKNLGNPVDGKHAAVLCPHGHGGRMQRFSDAQIEKEIAAGAERFVQSGQTPKLARCAQLARMGCVTFMFDMLGYGDSQQISQDTVHKHAALRPEDQRPADGSLPTSWPLFSMDAELRLQTVMGLQTWNAIRALDFLASLADVDPERLGVTGGSGGGTQTILLGAIDPRVKVSFPNGMVSTSMQGGCYCENCSLLRVEAGNVELAALMAPRPMACTAANDWTKDMLDDGYPELQQLYELFGQTENVECADMLRFPHNYNYVSRSVMYPWMNGHLGLGIDTPIVEDDFAVITDADGAVWNVQHPQPTQVGVSHEQAVCEWMDEQAAAGLQAWWPNSADQVADYQARLGQAWRTILSLPMSSTEDLNASHVETRGDVLAFDGVNVTSGLLLNSRRDSAVPFASLRASTHDSSNASQRHVLVWLRDGGKQSLEQMSSDERKFVKQWISFGGELIVPDLFGQGELACDGNTADRQRVIADPRPFAAFTFGYNRTWMADQVADALDLLAYCSQQDAKSVSILGTGAAAPVALAAAALTEEEVAKAAVMLDGFRFIHADSYASPSFVPGAVKYGDVESLMVLAAPRALLIRDTESIEGRANQMYALTGRAENLQRLKPADDQLPVKELIEFVTSPTK
ncbi:acetylxylan esterase [Allorhodopirellula heiligendammensis]|uniref:Alpha/beta hydrolase family protein n=1 Tax=Allorhodopirellula heiligendammensis TaxID=2714739 RepID=A0A5C6C8J4_9BACT|nr:acetylxylan esterase [Allorhodopirellula heiligendammensis]TWU19664.1 Alpha/beta hydrolase family protein [Allorhodopirellula heiligendammensis]